MSTRGNHFTNLKVKVTLRRKGHLRWRENPASSRNTDSKFTHSTVPFTKREDPKCKSRGCFDVQIFRTAQCTGRKALPSHQRCTLTSSLSIHFRLLSFLIEVFITWLGIRDGVSVLFHWTLSQIVFPSAFAIYLLFYFIFLMILIISIIRLLITLNTFKFWFIIQTSRSRKICLATLS